MHCLEHKYWLHYLKRKTHDDFFKCTSSISNNGSDLALSHERFDQGVVEYCNNGAVVGMSLMSENGGYTSQFNITVSSEQLLAGGMIECLNDNGFSCLW